MMEYLPIQDFTEKWNISKRRIQVLCKEGRISGAKMIGNMWVIPENSVRPSDARIKNPTICPPNVKESNVRKELKKLLKTLYKISTELNIKECERKAVVLSTIAYALCAFYLEEKELEDNYKATIYKDISGKEYVAMNDGKLIREVLDFIEEHKDNRELDNLLSWAYQYMNKIIKGNIYSRTQFFTEKYMIDYLIHNILGLGNMTKIVDPCVGGGNFLTECLGFMCLQDSEEGDEFVEKVLFNASKLYGYDIDCDITRIALVNIRLRALAILKHRNENVSFELWNRIIPNIFKSENPDKVSGALSTDNRDVINVVSGEKIGIDFALGEAEVVLTNPPFATIKGMLPEQREFLKKNYPDANCDMCASFFEAIYKMLKPTGICGIVSQNSWMHLKTFKSVRRRITNQYCIYRMVNLGSGAFQDLSGEKSNVSLLVLGKEDVGNNKISVLNLEELTFREKVKAITEENNYIQILQREINGANGYDFSEKGMLNSISENRSLYKAIAIPMQGTSTGNAKELVGYFWKHFSDPEWVSVSNGGGYCRWQGLNDSVVKWGKDGEYIKEQKGSALRNVKYFPMTQMVFSDTGTAGLNVRVLLENQIFIASGPGIRIIKGNKYAHLALLNSRLAAYFVRTMSPKLTIAAGYIGQIPITENIDSSVVLEKNAKLCIELKQKILSTRPTNLEYESSFMARIPGDLKMAAWSMFNEDIMNELLKLQIEGKIDRYIFKEYGLSKNEMEQLTKRVGECAYFIDGAKDVELVKLDKYIAKLIDTSCSLKRTKTSRYALGCDGILEYVAKDLQIGPEIIVKKIQEDPFVMQMVLGKYQKMILHDAVLYYLGYNTKDGVMTHNARVEDVAEFLSHKFGKGIEYKLWIEKSFNSIHCEMFKGVPYLIYENGVIQQNDGRIAG